MLITATIILFACSKEKKSLDVVYNSDLLKIEKLSDHVYLHISYLNTEEWGMVPCNGMVYVCGNEAAVFDTPVDDPSSEELISWIEQVLHKEIIAIIPTHYHGDNLGGLNAFHQHEIPSLAYRKTLQIAQERNLTQPQFAFDPKVEITVDSITMYVEFLGEGHTADNVVVYIPEEKTLFGGCLIKALDYDKGNLAEANEEAWAETVRKVKSQYPDVKIVIPGHGKVSGVELLDYTIELFDK